MAQSSRALAVLGGLGTLALLLGPLVTQAPNRLAQSEGLGAARVLATLPVPWPVSWPLTWPVTWPLLLGAVLALVGWVALLRRGRRVCPSQRGSQAKPSGAASHPGVCLAAAIGVAMLPATGWWLAGRYAQHVAQSDGLARVSVGWGLWCVLACALLACRTLMASVPRSGGEAHRGGRSGRSGGGVWVWVAPSAALLVLLLPLGALLAAGELNDLSLLREYAQRSDVFTEAIGQHLRLVGWTVALALLLGVPLGLLGAARAAWGQALGAVLGVVQTIPSVALYGLGMVPLGALAVASPWLASAGLAGVGTWPAVLALWLYALLPVVQGTLSGWQQVDASVLEAARAMGMSRAQVWWRVRAPLALPVLLGGVRVMVVQVIGLAVVAALIGAGGFGNLVFQGLYSSALDLVLLGVLPVVVLSLLADALLGALAQATSRSAS